MIADGEAVVSYSCTIPPKSKPKFVAETNIRPLQLNRDAITLGRGETDRMKLNEGHARSEDDEARGRHASAQLKQEAG